MFETMLPIFVAAAVVLMLFSVVQVVRSTMDPEKRKLKQRLTADGERPRTDGGAVSIVHQTEVTGFSAVLVRFSLLNSIQRQLHHAYPDVSVARFLGYVVALAIVGFLLVTLLSGSVLVGLVTGGLGATFPFLMVTGKRNRRQKTLSEQIPESLDFLSRILKAGHSLSTGLSMMGEELPQPIAAEFRRAYDQHSLGQSLENSLRDMAGRIESTDFAFFVTAVLIQRQTGGDLSEVLNNISGMIRQRIRLQGHVRAKTAEGRFTGYILVAFPAVMFVLVSVMNPAYAQTLTGTSTGQKLLGLAFFLQVLGLWMIRKLTTVRV